MDQYLYEQLDDYTQGWTDADEAIKAKLAGQRVSGLDYSQGNTEWDKGWNARLQLEERTE